MSTMLEHEITASVQPAAAPDDDETWGPGSHHWTVTLMCEGRTMVVPFHQGSAHTAPPTVDDVLDALLVDAALVESDELDETVEGLPYRKAHAIVTAATEQTEALRVFLGEHYEPMLWGE